MKYLDQLIALHERLHRDRGSAAEKRHQERFDLIHQSAAMSEPALRKGELLGILTRFFVSIESGELGGMSLPPAEYVALHQAAKTPTPEMIEPFADALSDFYSEVLKCMATLHKQ